MTIVTLILALMAKIPVLLATTWKLYLTVVSTVEILRKLLEYLG